MWDEWAKKISASAGSDSPNIYQNYATAGVINASPDQFVGAKANIDAQSEEAAARAAVAKKRADMEAEAQKLADSVDPSKARMQLAEDGGYDFFDGAGNPIDINKFSLITNKRPDDLLKDSENPQDQQFARDYGAMRDIAQAWINNDQETITRYRANPANIYKDEAGVVHNRFDDFMGQFKTPGDMVNGFKRFYGRYYGSPQGERPQQLETPTAFTGERPPGIDPKDKAWQALSTATPEQNQQLIPGLKAPQAGEGIGGFVNNINPFSQFNRDKYTYEEYLKKNPWASYYTSLAGR